MCNGDEAALESWWAEKFDAKFGRYMAWVWFSVGAENLVKAALVCHGLLEAKHQNYSYPVYWGDTDKGSWVERVLGSRRNAGGGYGEMGDIWRCKLDDLSDKLGDAEAERKDLKAAYQYLTQVVRNRDAHSYVTNQRRKDLLAVDPIFVPAFNKLVQAMRDRGHFKATGHD
ncbi:MAG: hypothetical protein F4X64_13175 [Chloroflexi bacterium]|nr:hypothetical protein [Chloroflexota bacterium]